MRKKKRLLAFILTLVMIVSSIGVMPANTQVSAASKVKVTNVTNKKKTMYVGAIYNLKTNKKAVTFSSNKPSVVKVTNTGTLYAKKKGTAYITVKDANGTKIKVKVTVKKAKGFKVRKISGTYSSTVKVKITAKQNYKVYYSTSAKFKKNKVVKSGKSKTLTLKKTKTLRIFVVKNSAKVKVKTMNKQSSRWKDIRFVQYKYIIKSGTEAETVTEVPENTETSTETITENTETTTESTSESTEATTEATENTEVITETTTETTTESSTEDTGEEIPEEPVEEPELNISSSSDSEDNPGFTYTDNDGVKTLEIIQDGTFVLSGGTEDSPIKNTQIIIASELSEVKVTLDNLVLDNSVCF